MQRDSMVFYRSFHEATRELPSEIYKEAMVALMDYALDGRINVFADGKAPGGRQ